MIKIYKYRSIPVTRLTGGKNLFRSERKEKNVYFMEDRNLTGKNRPIEKHIGDCSNGRRILFFRLTVFSACFFFRHFFFILALSFLFFVSTNYRKSRYSRKWPHRVELVKWKRIYATGDKILNFAFFYFEFHISRLCYRIVLCERNVRIRIFRNFCHYKFHKTKTICNIESILCIFIRHVLQISIFLY